MFLDQPQGGENRPPLQALILRQRDGGFQPELGLAVRRLHVNVHTTLFP